MAGLMRDYEISKANYKSLLETGKKIFGRTWLQRWNAAKKPRGSRLSTRPASPKKPISPNRPLFLGLGCFLSVVLAFGISAGQDFKRGAVLGEWELPPETIVLGRVPEIETDKKSGPNWGKPNGTSASALTQPIETRPALLSSLHEAPWSDCGDLPRECIRSFLI